MLKQIDSSQVVTYKQAKQIIMANPTAVYLLRGARGTGKTSLVKDIAKDVGYKLCLIQGAQTDVGDLKMPIMKDGAFVFGPNESFGLHTGEPVVFFVDEFTKMGKASQNAVHEAIEPDGAFCGIPLHRDSIRIIAGNLDEEGLGDRILDHTHDRVIELVVSGANHDDMIEYAIQSGWHETVIAFMYEYPQVLLTVLDGDSWKDSPYKGVTRRGLEGVSDIMHSSYGKLPSELLATAIAGRVGSAFAKQFQAFVDYKDQVPSHDEVVNDPTGAKLPTSQGAACVFVFGAITKVTKDNVDKYMKYFSRFEPEWEMMFSLTMAKQKQAVAFNSDALRDWLLTTSDLR